MIVTITCPDCGHEVEVQLQDKQIIRHVSADVVLSRAGKIQSHRRKTKSGGRPSQVWPCRWCQTRMVGLKDLREHERNCLQNPHRPAMKR